VVHARDEGDAEEEGEVEGDDDDGGVISLSIPDSLFFILLSVFRLYTLPLCP